MGGMHYQENTKMLLEYTTRSTTSEQMKSVSRKSEVLEDLETSTVTQYELRIDSISQNIWLKSRSLMTNVLILKVAKDLCLLLRKFCQQKIFLKLHQQMLERDHSIQQRFECPGHQFQMFEKRSEENSMDTE